MPSNQSQTHSNLSAMHNVRKQPVECHRTGSPLPFPNAVQRALICLQGERVCIYDTLFDSDSRSVVVPHNVGPAERRAEKDAAVAVVARPNGALALSLCVTTSDVLIHTHETEWFVANCAALDRFHFNVRGVLAPGMVVHAWLYATRSGTICLGAYDLVMCERLKMTACPAFERSSRLQQLFTAAAAHASENHMQHFEYVWVGQLGGDAALGAACTGACAMLYDARCPYDVAVFVTVPNNCDAHGPVRWIDATPTGDLQRCDKQRPARDRAAALTVQVPR